VNGKKEIQFIAKDPRLIVSSIHILFAFIFLTLSVAAQFTSHIMCVVANERIFSGSFFILLCYFPSGRRPAVTSTPVLLIQEL
jgi:hypothetical protein